MKNKITGLEIEQLTPSIVYEKLKEIKTLVLIENDNEVAHIKEDELLELFIENIAHNMLGIEDIIIIANSFNIYYNGSWNQSWKWFA